MVFDRLARLLGGSPDDGESMGQREVDLAEQARGTGITPELLAGADGRTAEPIVRYLEEDEQPVFAIRGGLLRVADGDGSVTREPPSRELTLLVTDRRVLFVKGGRLSDDLWGVPFEDVAEVYLDEEDVRAHVVLEAADDEVTAFYADVSLEPDLDEVREAVAYVRENTS